MSTESDAKEALILQLIDGYSGLRPTDAFIDALLRTVEPYSVEAVATACRRFEQGEVASHNNAFPVTGPELAEECRRIDESLAQALGYDRAYPKITTIPPGYKTTADGRLLMLPAGAEPPPGFRTVGPSRINFGHGADIDMRKMSPEQKDMVIALKRMPKSEVEIAAFDRLGPPMERPQQIEAPAMRRMIGRG